MSKVNSLLSQRLKSPLEKLSKMTDLAEKSSSGGLSSFSGVFKVSALSDKEQETLKTLLEKFATQESNTDHDYERLSDITSEIKAINNQAAILHGERIKKAQTLLKNYEEGAFTLWLMHTYGNRQTPYNFLQYYELYKSLPSDLIEKLDEMPRQAAYTLASREGEFALKKSLIEEYKGETKKEVLEEIRRRFPLKEKDKRGQNHGLNLIKSLTRILDFLETNPVEFSSAHKKKILPLLDALKKRVNR